jgi:hypothetical protein
MRGAVVVTGGMALQAEDALPAPRQMMDRRTPHGAQPADDDVK